jgi:UDP-N-acetylmuramate dehydrogenase
MTTPALVLNQQHLKGELLFNESLADYNTWRVGGQAKALYKPQGLDDLAVFLKECPLSERLLCLGLGSNSLIKDTGFSGVVVLMQGCLSSLAQIAPDKVRVEAGVSCAKMARFCTRNQLTGGEFWAGVPGTMGGALRMNAGCFKKETWETVVEVETITRSGDIRHRKPEEFRIAYRHVSGLEEGEWFVAATCRLIPGDQAHSAELIKELLAHRAATQPTNAYNCGSVFRNPPGQFAAKLIESCGLKGYRIGGAVVSEKHANFILNADRTASANDIEELIDFVQRTVFEKTGVQLIREVIVLGDDACRT